MPLIEVMHAGYIIRMLWQNCYIMIEKVNILCTLQVQDNLFQMDQSTGGFHTRTLDYHIGVGSSSSADYTWIPADFGTTGNFSFVLQDLNLGTNLVLLRSNGTQVG